MLVYAIVITVALAATSIFFPIPIMLISMVAAIIFASLAYKKPAFIAVTPWIYCALSAVVLIISIISYISRHLTWVW